MMHRRATQRLARCHILTFSRSTRNGFCWLLNLQCDRRQGLGSTATLPFDSDVLPEVWGGVWAPRELGTSVVGLSLYHKVPRIQGAKVDAFKRNRMRMASFGQ